jgi:hypothetical protein
MSNPPIASEFWMKTPTLNVAPTAKGPNAGGLAGQPVAFGVVMLVFALRGGKSGDAGAP